MGAYRAWIGSQESGLRSESWEPGTDWHEDGPGGHSGAGEPRGERTAPGAAGGAGQRVLRGRGGHCWQPCPARRGSEGAGGAEGSGSRCCLRANSGEYLPGTWAGVGAGTECWLRGFLSGPSGAEAGFAGRWSGEQGGRLLRRARSWAAGSGRGGAQGEPPPLSLWRFTGRRRCRCSFCPGLYFWRCC